MAALIATFWGSEARSDPIRVLIIGDSISTSEALGPPGLYPGVPFSDQLEPKLGPDFKLINVGCGGSTSIDWSTTTPGRLCPFSALPTSPDAPLGLVEEFVRPHLPVSIATILLGTNDSTGFLEPEDLPVLPDAYGGAIDELVAFLLAGGVETVILMTPPKMADFTALTFLSDYRKEILARCSAGGSVICGPDLYLALFFGTDFLNDGIHPNAQGHDKITEALYQQLLAVPELNGRTAQYIALLCIALLRNRKKHRVRYHKYAWRQTACPSPSVEVAELDPAWTFTKDGVAVATAIAIGPCQRTDQSVLDRGGGGIPLAATALESRFRTLDERFRAEGNASRQVSSSSMRPTTRARTTCRASLGIRRS